jgi:transcriptional regulator with XRE-family HTH domain
MTLMTGSAPPPHRAAGRVSLHTLVARYGTQAEAAKNWGVSQSAVSRLLRGERGSRNSDALRAIAKVEGLDASLISMGQSELRLHDTTRDGGRFVFSIDDPAYMLEQLAGWFGDLPRETRMHRQVLRACMRAIFDESFDSIHSPPADWQRTMDHLHGSSSVVRFDRGRTDRGRSGT